MMAESKTKKIKKGCEDPSYRDVFLQFFAEIMKNDNAERVLHNMFDPNNLKFTLKCLFGILKSDFYLWLLLSREIS